MMTIASHQRARAEGWMRRAFWLSLGLGLVGLIASGCAGDDCGDCASGCCRDGECIELLSQADAFCGFGGGECQDCTASGMTCDTTQGMCTNGATGTFDPTGGTTQLTPNTGANTGTTTPIQSNLLGCSNCTVGCCDGATGQCIPEGQACSTAGTICRSGSCQLDESGNTQQPSGWTCPTACNPPFECYQGRCMGKVEKCQMSCNGCCTNEGKCYALGASQSDYACGRDGEICTDCMMSRQVCNEQRGQCEMGSLGDWEVCVISAEVSGRFSDCDKPGATESQKAPDMYVEFRVGGTHKETGKTSGMRRGYNWVGAWVSDRACVKINGAVAGNDGVTVVVKDSDWGGCRFPFLDWTDDVLGHCTLYSDAFQFNQRDSFLSIGGAACQGDLVQLEIKYTAYPNSQ
jgi:hypothetical protein